MSVESVITWLVALASLLGAIAAIIKAYKTSPGETVDVAQKYQAIAAKAAEEADKANARCDDLEKRLREQGITIESMERTLNEYKHGTALLVHQLEANGIAPVWHPKS